VVLSRVDSSGRPRHTLDAGAQKEMVEFFRRYKEGQAGLFSTVAGWGSIENGRAYVTTTHAFFRQCAARPGAACRLN
jgi:hypothetical protein